MVRVILDDEVFDRTPLGPAFRARLYVTFGILVSLLSDNVGSYRTSSSSALRPAISTVSPGLKS